MVLAPTEGTYAAELNADEESTLYQNVKTSPSSVYEWGLDHGARNGTDTMALIIGPKQSVNPSKPSKAGRDQFMQMVDWLIEKGMTSFKTSAGLGEQLTVYSKKFAAKGTFEDNAGNNAFSLTPSTIYTEQWKIWILASSKGESGTNPWNSYGSIADTSNSGGLDLNKYYLYTVPANQTETIFGFVSVGYVDSTAPAGKEKTYGNFLDNIQFRLYYQLSGGTSNHGSAIVESSDGSSEGEGSGSGYQITVGDKLMTYVTEGESLKIQAVVKAADADDGCQFIGFSHTRLDDAGNPVYDFCKVAGNEIEDNGSLTDEEKKGKWVKSTNENGDVIYTYYLENITSSTDLYFVFIKHPTITYDSNGGKPYVIEDRPYAEEENENVYSFRPVSGEINENSFIKPYVSKAAEGQNDGWKFVGWKLMGDIVNDIPPDVEQVHADELGNLILPAVHSVACDYDLSGAAGNSAEQYFKFYDGNISFNKTVGTEENGQVSSVTWNDGGSQKLYANVHRGLTMIAQWRWRQAFIPQTLQNGVASNSTVGGKVEITSIASESDENYNGAYNEDGGKAYYAAIDETVSVKAIANEGWRFLGWYDENGDLVSILPEYGYIETKESVKTYYARFSNSITQTYIRQIKNGDRWENTTDDNVGTIDRYSYIDAIGMPISATASAQKGYQFVGWYDYNGNKVPDNMLINNGTTISYTTTDDATYYARYENAYTLRVSKIDGDKSTEENKVPLAGAEFALYQKDSGGSETIEYEGVSIQCKYIGSATSTLTKDGKLAYASFNDALLTGREYYLVETKPPFGYNILNKIMKIEFIDTDADASGYYTVEIPNQSGITLPQAGGIGTTLFSIIGLVLIVGLFVILHYKQSC